MTKTIGKVILACDVNRTEAEYLEIVRSGGCVHVNAYAKKKPKQEYTDYINFQLTDANFKKWAEMFSLIASEL